MKSHRILALALTAAVALLAGPWLLSALQRPAPSALAALGAPAIAHPATGAEAPPPSKKGKSMSNFAKPTDAELKARLTPLQYEVTQKEGTEPSFRNEYWNEKRPGIYVDIVSGEPLFSSLHKFDSGTGWPSFDRPLETETIKEHADTSHGMRRVEVLCGRCDAHLGHLFDDGPAPTGQRFCMNSVALKLEKKE